MLVKVQLKIYSFKFILKPNMCFVCEENKIVHFHNITLNTNISASNRVKN